VTSVEIQDIAMHVLFACAGVSHSRVPRRVERDLCLSNTHTSHYYTSGDYDLRQGPRKRHSGGLCLCPCSCYGAFVFVTHSTLLS
jgi:hypothetical protein